MTEMSTLKVRDLMTGEVMTLQPTDDLSALYELMESHHVRHVPIVDEDGDLIGLVTKRDLLRNALSAQEDLPLSVQNEVLGGAQIAEIMTTAVETIEPDNEISEAAQIMFENKFGCLPVVEGDHLVGILTEADFVRFLAENTPASRSVAPRQSA